MIARRLYDANREVHSLLRYGVKVQPAAGEQTITVWLIDWTTSTNNDFAIAEEVTVAGENAKRPGPRALYQRVRHGSAGVEAFHGIRGPRASAKTSIVRRRSLSARSTATVQLVMAGNDTEGLRYGVIEDAPRNYWLRWKEADAHPTAGDNPLLRELSQLCNKDRLLEIVHDFMVFDAGVKKICRHNPVLRGTGGARTRAASGRRHHLAHPRQRKEPDHGVAGEVDSRACGWQSGADRH